MLTCMLCNAIDCEIETQLGILYSNSAWKTRKEKEKGM